MRCLALALLPLALTACPTTGKSYPGLDGGSFSGVPEPAPDTNVCAGDKTRCLYGTVTTLGFTVPYLFARAFVYSVYPNGDAKPVGSGSGSDGGNEVAKDGTFALGNLDPLNRYYLRVLARFDPDAPNATVESIVGPLTIPSTGPIEVKIRPVSLEALQGRVAAGGTATTLTWASVRVLDPANGHELTDATVSFHSGQRHWTLPYTTNIAGKKSYFLSFASGTEGNTLFAGETTHPSMGSVTWSLVGELPKFDGALTQPLDGAVIGAKKPLTVAWQPQPLAAYMIVQLFLSQGGTYISKYESPGPLAPTVANVTIPGEKIDTVGKYLLNVQYAKTTCPPTADGCVYNTITAVSNVTAQ
jgi:hypothetical protein